MTGTLDTIARAAASNGWTAGYSGSDHVFTRGNVVVSVTMTARNAVATANRTDASNPRQTFSYSLRYADAGKRETVLEWLTADAGYPIPTADDAAVTAIDPFTAPSVTTYPVPTADDADATDPFTADDYHPSFAVPLATDADADEHPSWTAADPIRVDETDPTADA